MLSMTKLQALLTEARRYYKSGRLKQGDTAARVLEELRRKPGVSGSDLLCRVFGYRHSHGRILHWSVLERYLIQTHNVNEATEAIKQVEFWMRKQRIEIKTKNNIKRLSIYRPQGRSFNFGMVGLSNEITSGLGSLFLPTEWAEWDDLNSKVEALLETLPYKVAVKCPLEIFCRDGVETPFERQINNCQKNISRAIKQLIRDDFITDELKPTIK